MSDRMMNSRKERCRLAPSEKYEMFVSALTRQAKREAAVKWKVRRSTVMHVCRDREAGRAGRALAALDQGRPGRSGCEAALAGPCADLGRWLRAPAFASATCTASPSSTQATIQGVWRSNLLSARYVASQGQTAWVHQPATEVTVMEPCSHG